MSAARHLLARRRLHHARGLVRTTRRHPLAVGAEGHRIHTILMSEARDLLARRRVHHARGPVLDARGRGHPLAVRAEGHRSHRTLMSEARHLPRHEGR